MIRVLLVDDHGIIRDALYYLLSAQGDIDIIGTAVDGQDAVEQVRLDCPDVIVMDIAMPRMDGLQATREICRSCPSTRVVMLTIYDTREHIEQALNAGAQGYVLKDAAGRELVEAVRTLHAGGKYFSKKISDML
ncbi:MAG TPA: response regulator transcription factor [Anaerolineales bacterium]|nr:response regulator transcription factor [Anaerolineales bacterium]